MDQAASVMSIPDSALYVKPYPHLAASPAALPLGTLVLANSYVISEKAVYPRAFTRYNLRVIEALACRPHSLSRHPGIEVCPRDRITLREIVGRFGRKPIEGWSQDSVRLRAALERSNEHIGILRLAIAPMAKKQLLRKL